ncbi:unnamed protein product [Ranitomeya imitator]|uniref:Uncharacterized protein n=1 Tax=Ranitomeya imitator TaxID=111125 RepID=A0ABN9KWV1_9NEOB|nr:unnamed protein product [Ranitomeya imitator]
MIASMEAVLYAQFLTRPLQLALLSVCDKKTVSLDRLVLLPLKSLLAGKPICIQLDIATAVAYVNHQGRTRSKQVMTKVTRILRWAEHRVPAISAVYIPGVENWAADFLSRQGLASGEWSLNPAVFNQICQRWATLDIDLMASQMNRKFPLFVARSLDPLAISCDALVIPWSQFQLPYLFLPLPLIPWVVKKIKTEGIPVILIAPDWPRHPWYAELEVSSFHINEDIVLPSLCLSPVNPLEKSLHKLDLAIDQSGDVFRATYAAFRCSHVSGILGAHEKLKVPVTFFPRDQVLGPRMSSSFSQPHLKQKVKFQLCGEGIKDRSEWAKISAETLVKMEDQVKPRKRSGSEASTLKSSAHHYINLPVKFKPTAAGKFEGHLVVQTDAGDISIQLVGEALTK